MVMAIVPGVSGTELEALLERGRRRPRRMEGKYLRSISCAGRCPLCDAADGPSATGPLGDPRQALILSKLESSGEGVGEHDP